MTLELTDRKVDLFDGSVDLAIRFSEQVDDDAVIAKKLAPNRRLICAAPAYLERFGMPGRFSDLAAHNCLRLSTVDSWNDWRLMEPSTGEPIAVTGNFEINSADGIYHATLAGLGIARLSAYLINEDIRIGRLQHLFPDYADNSSSILAIYAQKKNLSPKIRACIDYLVGVFGAVPPWERQPTGQ